MYKFLFYDRVTDWINNIRREQTERTEEETGTMRNARNVNQKLSAECAVQLTE